MLYLNVKFSSRRRFTIYVVDDMYNWVENQARMRTDMQWDTKEVCSAMRESPCVQIPSGERRRLAGHVVFPSPESLLRVHAQLRTGNPAGFARSRSAGKSKRKSKIPTLYNIEFAFLR